MIKLFRNIRKNLLNEGKTSKYFKYAVGEILLVVIGILIALQINTWNQNKQDRKQESEILSQLLEEYKSNLIQIDSKISLRKEVINSSLKLLDSRNTDIELINIDSINLYINKALYRPTFDPELGVSSELMNSGKLYLLSNSSLRSKISSFSSSLLELKEEETILVNWTEERIIPFLITHYQIGQISMGFLDDYKTREAITQIQFSKDKSLKELFAKTDPTPLLNQPDFEDYLSLMITNTIYTNDQSKGVKNKIEDIISLIEKEMDK